MADAQLKILPDDNQQAGLATARRELAAAFRLAERMGYSEAVANHFSLAVNEDGSEFLVNPYAKHWSLVKASDLLLLNAHGSAEMAESWQVDRSAWCIHGPIHRKLPHARCLLHTHMKYATVLSCLKDSNLLPIDQNSMRFFGRIAIDQGFEGMALSEAEGERLASVLGDKSILIMGNHGVLIAGTSVARAFDDLYYFERACEVLVTAYMTGRELRVASDETASRTAREWETFDDSANRHFSQLMQVLDRDAPDYRD